MAEAMALPALRRAWLRELGVEHVWATPGGALAGGPLAARAAAPAAPVADAGPAAVSAAVGGGVDTPPDAGTGPDGAVARQDVPTSSAPAGVPVDAAASTVAAGRGLAATRWLAWQADAPGQSAWMILARAEDAGAPEAQRFLATLMRAAGRTLTPLASQRRGADAPPAAVVAVGAAARTALGCSALEWMAVGEGSLRGAPVRVLALPPLADVTAAAECKAPAWRGLVRLGLA